MDDDGSRPLVYVKFTRVGRVHGLSTPDSAPGPPLVPGDDVVVRSAGALSYATVVRGIPALSDKQPAKAGTDAVVRRVTPEDAAARVRISQREHHAHQVCLLKIRERGLPMKLTSVEQLTDGSRLIFYFTADGRVDFRELVRDLAAEFRTRIEMRQIGVRDESRMLGGYGGCGRPLCCTTWLQSFEPVSIKMAKQQKLSLNPTKLSGLCGRLKCCLRYELGSEAENCGRCPSGAAHESHGPEAASTGAEGAIGCCAGASGGGCGGCCGG